MQTPPSSSRFISKKAIWRCYTAILVMVIIGIIMVPIQMWLTRFSRDPNKFVVLVFSSHSNVAERKAIRETWVDDIYRLNRVAYFFVIGTSQLSDDIKYSLKQEHAKYGDILTLSVNDKNDTTTRKLSMALDAIASLRYLHFDYIMKCDDSTFIRIPDVLGEVRNLENEYLQTDCRRSVVANIFRSTGTAEYVSIEVQSNKRRYCSSELYWGYFRGNASVFKTKKCEENWILCDFYIPHAVGGSYVLSRNMVLFIVRNMPHVRHYHSEDVSVGAWLAPINNIVRIHDRRFDTEYVSRGCQNYYLVRHNISPEEMRIMYANLKEKQQLCAEETRTRKEYIYDWSVPPSKCCDRAIE